MNPEDIAKKALEAPDTTTPINFEELQKVFSSWLLMKDPGVLKLIAAVVIANKLSIDPVWVFLVAPSGGGKTELINSLKKLENVFMLSSLTPQTLISGMKGRDKSLLFKINGKIIVFKDFTTILSSHAEPQNEILGQLREIYDGHFRKEFGTGEGIEWEGKIGFIAGVTSVIDKHTNVHKSLGERFLQYRIAQPDRKAVTQRIRENMTKQSEMRAELSAAMCRYIAGIRIPADFPVITEEVNTKIMELADLVSRIRSAVFRDMYGREKEIVFVPEIEMSTRIYTQLMTVALGLLVVNAGKFEKEDYQIIYKLGIDSIHYLKMKILNEMKDYKGWLKTTTLAVAIDYSTMTTRGYLEELTALGLVQRAKPRENVDVWRIRPEMLEMWSRARWEAEAVAYKEDIEATKMMAGSIEAEVANIEEPIIEPEPGTIFE